MIPKLDIQVVSIRPTLACSLPAHEGKLNCYLQQKFSHTLSPHALATIFCGSLHGLDTAGLLQAC